VLTPDRVDALVWALTELMIEGFDEGRQLFVA
jgi:phage terminase large subunit-like protein